MGILWIIVGGVIGVMAASKNGFSVVGGFVGGALLGASGYLDVSMFKWKETMPFLCRTDST